MWDVVDRVLEAEDRFQVWEERECVLSAEASMEAWFYL